MHQYIAKKAHILFIALAVSFHSPGSTAPLHATPIAGPVNFWYFHLSGGNARVLVDFIDRPNTRELRVAIWEANKKPYVISEYFDNTESPLNSWDVLAGENSFSLNGANLRTNTITLNLQFNMREKGIDYTPPGFAWSNNVLPHIPNMKSRFGTIKGTFFDEAIDGVSSSISKYRVSNLSDAEWHLITCNQFDESDMQLEVATTKLGLGLEISGAYIYLNGTTKVMNNPFTNLFNINSRVRYLHDSKVFEGTILKDDLNLDIQCTAKEDDFVLLSKEGNTQINTTLLGTCKVVISSEQKQPQTLVSTRSCLLEEKTSQ